MEDQELDGLWRYTAYQEGGRKRPPEQLALMHKLVLLVGEHLPGWDGLWAAIAYGHQGGKWSEVEIRDSCRHIILGSKREEKAPANDLYLWAGGRFLCASGQRPNEMEIDFEQYWRGEVLPSLNLGLYFTNGERLTLCLAEAGGPRPSEFTSRENEHQSLGELVRVSGA